MEPYETCSRRRSAHDESIDLDRVFDAQQLTVEETDTVPAQVRGVLLGGMVGAALALVLRWTLAMSQFGFWYTIVFGAVAGMLLGGLAAGLVGAAMPDRQLRKLKRDLDQGSVLVTFSVSGADAEKVVQRVLRQRGVRGVQQKHVV
jgi:hypothetical protein